MWDTIWNVLLGGGGGGALTFFAVRLFDYLRGRTKDGIEVEDANAARERRRIDAVIKSWQELYAKSEERAKNLEEDLSNTHLECDQEKEKIKQEKKEHASRLEAVVDRFEKGAKEQHDQLLNTSLALAKAEFLAGEMERRAAERDQQIAKLEQRITLYKSRLGDTPRPLGE